MGEYPECGHGSASEPPSAGTPELAKRSREMGAHEGPVGIGNQSLKSRRPTSESFCPLPPVMRRNPSRWGVVALTNPKESAMTATLSIPADSMVDPFDLEEPDEIEADDES